MIEEYSSKVGEEMDFVLEASYARRIRDNFKGHRKVAVPRVIDTPGHAARAGARVHGRGAHRSRGGRSRRRGARPRAAWWGPSWSSISR
ncbi:MAG: hypothetical protein IPK33_08960 [Gemmatimonadetes bacterium]|nr:hypothetical protein [Gemmatimonadota bacterium]